jgi:2,4-didehydro-3-deoxy-L-rhamnonate hydrolase
MRLFKMGLFGHERCAVIEQGRAYWVDEHFMRFDEAFFTENGLSKLKKLLIQQSDVLPLIKNWEGLRLGAPIDRPSKIVCIGLNYAQHAAESGMAIPTEPIVFFKSTTAICGPNDPVVLPPGSEKTDWEVELSIIIGKKASYVAEADAMNYVAGYTIHNDYSERAYQLERGGQWVKGKSCDTFAPLGPYLVTVDEVPDPHNLHLWLQVNGEMLQNSNTNDMIFKIPYIISYLSHFMTLLPGDVISTGTPFGVGLGLNPPRYLKAGDVVTLGIEGLGIQQQTAVNWVKKVDHD